MRHVRLNALCVLLLCSLTAAALGDDKIQLSLKLAKGQQFTQTVDTAQKISQEVQGNKQVIEQSMTIVTKQTVTDVDGEGVASLELVYDAVKWSQSGPFGKQSFDSTTEKEATAPQARPFAAMVGQKLSMKITPQGKVTQITGVDKLVEKIIEGLQLPPGAQADAVIKQIKTQFGEEAMKRQMEQMSAIYPPAAVGLGDSWKHTVEVSMGAPMTISTMYTLEGRKDGLASVKSDGKVESPENAAPIAAGPMLMKMVLSGTQVGKLHIDEATGMVMKADLDQDLTGNTVMMTQKGVEVMKVPMTIVSKIKMSTAK